MKSMFPILVWMCFLSSAFAQSAKTSPLLPNTRQLVVTDTLSANAFGAAMQLPIRCDEDQNIYLRFFHSKGAPQEPIHKLNRKGEHLIAYPITSDSEFAGKGKAGLDFALDNDGNIYQLAIGDEGNNYIVSYGKDGTVKAKTRLQAMFNPYHFQPFASGKFFLIVGADRETDANLSTHALYNGLFDSNGRLIKKISFAEDRQYQQSADRGDAEFIEPGRAGGGNFVAERGSLTLAPDGNVYVMRWSTPAKIYVVNSGGEVVRSFSVESPEGTKPGAIHASGNTLAIQFEGTEQDPRSVVQIINGEGEMQATYDTSTLGIAFACYAAPDKFLFLGRKEQALQFNFAAPQ